MAIDSVHLASGGTEHGPHILGWPNRLVFTQTPIIGIQSAAAVSAGGYKQLVITTRTYSPNVNREKEPSLKFSSGVPGKGSR